MKYPGKLRMWAVAWLTVFATLNLTGYAPGADLIDSLQQRLDEMKVKQVVERGQLLQRLLDSAKARNDSTAMAAISQELRQTRKAYEIVTATANPAGTSESKLTPDSLAGTTWTFDTSAAWRSIRIAQERAEVLDASGNVIAEATMEPVWPHFWQIKWDSESLFVQFFPDTGIAEACLASSSFKGAMAMRP
ncbi:MAG: hypothetical protein KDK99_14475 [Verrucomicrobiales bacterium]|nr:hypothetical protein [Verrucomicrobiales bacterium]